MKKALLLLMIASYTCVASAHRGLEGLRRENIHICSTVTKNNQQNDEYEQIGDDNLQEYEQHVCDNAKPQKISALLALLDEVGGRVLVKLIVLREALYRYYVALQTAITHWFGYGNNSAQ